MDIPVVGEGAVGDILGSLLYGQYILDTPFHYQTLFQREGFALNLLNL